MEAGKLARILLFSSRCKAPRARTRVGQGEGEEREGAVELARLDDSLDVRGGIKDRLKMITPGHIYAVDGDESLERGSCFVLNK